MLALASIMVVLSTTSFQTPAAPEVGDLVRMTFASGACPKVGFTTSTAAATARVTSYIDSAVAQGLTPAEAMAPVREEAHRYERRFRALFEAMAASPDSDQGATNAFVTATSELCFEGARRWPDVVLTTPDAPRSEADVRERLVLSP